jgi:RNA polymerase sigma-B factor
MAAVTHLHSVRAASPTVPSEDDPQSDDELPANQLADDHHDHRSGWELARWTRDTLRQGRERGGLALQEAQAEVITEHLWLARAVARRYHHRGEDDEDLVQVASAGLVEAVRRFDPDRGDFLAFAVPTIGGVVKRHFRDHGWLVRPPRRTQELASTMRREWGDITQELGHVPTEKQMAERLGHSHAEIAEARYASQGYRPVSVEALTEDHPRLKTPTGQEVDQLEARMIIERALHQLDQEEQRLIWMRFYEGRSQSDIAAEIGTSQMQISRRLARLLGHLRTIIGPVDQALAS